jgi:hypothetical protein
MVTVLRFPGPRWAPQRPRYWVRRRRPEPGQIQESLAVFDNFEDKSAEARLGAHPEPPGPRGMIAVITDLSFVFISGCSDNFFVFGFLFRPQINTKAGVLGQITIALAFSLCFSRSWLLSSTMIFQ